MCTSDRKDAMQVHINKLMFFIRASARTLVDYLCEVMTEEVVVDSTQIAQKVHQLHRYSLSGDHIGTALIIGVTATATVTRVGMLVEERGAVLGGVAAPFNPTCPGKAHPIFPPQLCGFTLYVGDLLTIFRLEWGNLSSRVATQARAGWAVGAIDVAVDFFVCNKGRGRTSVFRESVLETVAEIPGNSAGASLIIHIGVSLNTVTFSGRRPTFCCRY